MTMSRCLDRSAITGTYTRVFKNVPTIDPGNDLENVPRIDPRNYETLDYETLDITFLPSYKYNYVLLNIRLSLPAQYKSCLEIKLLSYLIAWGNS